MGSRDAGVSDIKSTTHNLRNTSVGVGLTTKTDKIAF